MRKLPVSLLRLAMVLSVCALGLGNAGCSRFKGSDDGKPTSSPATTAAPAATPAAPVLAAGVYSMNKPIEEDPAAVVTRVSVDATSTTLDFTFTNNRKTAAALTLAPPGSRDAMFLELPGGKKVSIVSATGIATKPALTRVPPGATVKFTMVFGPLEPGVVKFDLYEGEGAKKAMPGDTTYWTIRDIELK